MNTKFIIIAIFSVILIISVICDEIFHENIRIFKYIAAIAGTVLMVITIHNTTINYKNDQQKANKKVEQNITVEKQNK